MSVTGKQVAEKAKSLLDMGTIPYVEGGHSMKGMDCQGLVRWALDELGVDNVTGTNTMWRSMLSEKGTIKECVDMHGEVPLGALIYIREFDGGEPEKYQDDGEGNVFHVYVKIDECGDACLIHASEGNKKVCTRSFNDEEIPNGGPNLYGLINGVQYVDSDDDDIEAESGGSYSWRPKYTRYVYKYKVKDDGDLLCMGDGVREIQKGLNLCGHSVDIDGEFGPLTEAAVIEFQKDHDLEADGIVGKNTWAALVEAAND